MVNKNKRNHPCKCTRKYCSAPLSGIHTSMILLQMLSTYLVLNILYYIITNIFPLAIDLSKRYSHYPGTVSNGSLGLYISQGPHARQNYPTRPLPVSKPRQHRRIEPTGIGHLSVWGRGQVKKKIHLFINNNCLISQSKGSNCPNKILICFLLNESRAQFLKKFHFLFPGKLGITHS